MTITCVYGFMMQTFKFAVGGGNPTVAAVKARLGTSPWFLQQLVNGESGYAQFSSNSQPNFGPPNGFGIMQLDPPDDPYEIWTWTDNVDKGVARLNAFKATTYWQNQLLAESTYDNLNPGNPAQRPANQTASSCVFAYTPTGNQYPFSDAVWIKRYNSGFVRPYIAFNNGWVIDNLNDKGADYVSYVCSLTL